MSREYKRFYRCPSCKGGSAPTYVVTRRSDGARLCAYCRGEGFLTASQRDMANINDELEKLDWKRV